MLLDAADVAFMLDIFFNYFVTYMGSVMTNIKKSSIFDHFLHTVYQYTWTEPEGSYIHY